MTRILVTSALPYINGVKHLGNLVGSMLPADVYARFERQRKGSDHVLFVCATDEHGTPAELAALEEGLDVAAYCAKWHAIQSDLGRGFSLSFDVWGRSSSDQNRRLTQGFARTLWQRGHIRVEATKQVFSHADKRFLPDRYVIGTCPHCGYDRARGDQCENCTRVLDPVDLIAPRSALSGSADIEIRESKHLFLKQSAFVPQLRHWIEGKRSEWPALVTSIALKWLDEGLQDRGITRDLSWGVPVDVADWGPNPDGDVLDPADFAAKVFYVWFDAPIEYIGATAEWAAARGLDDGAWERWWRNDRGAADVEYVQFMGKDNVPFHTVGFPVTLLGVNEDHEPGRPWKLVDRVKGFNWLTYYGGKFSTSQKRGVFMDTALEVLPADYWRWYLIANAPEGSDSSFTWEHFAATVNKDLADVLGNFVNRVLKFTASKFGESVPEGGEPSFGAMGAALPERLAELTDELENLNFRKASQALRGLWVLANEFVAAEGPWTMFKADPAKAAAQARTAINLMAIIGHASAPFVPDLAARIRAALGIEGDPVWPHFGGHGDTEAALRGFLPAGQRFTVPDVLVRKIEDSQVAEWQARFGGAA